MKLLAEDPAKRAFERAVLVYSPLWIGAVAIVMLTGMLRSWRDPAHLAFGVGLALPVVLLPFLPAALDRERDLPLFRRYAAHAVVYVGIATMVQMYLGSYLFFGELGMEYHFHTTWSWNGSPVFLYPMTLAYFATYYVVMQVAARVIGLPASGAKRWLVLAVVSYAVAFAETAFMATPVMAEFFFYRHKAFMLLFGSFCYGTVFFATLPAFLRLSEQRSLGRTTLAALFANAIALACYGAYGLVLPHLPRF